jgi:Ca2+-binding EF-hand superfamily protein
MSSIGSVGGSRQLPPRPPSFEKLDGDSNGALSLDEFKSGAPKGADRAKSEELFKSIDADSSGSISKEESDAFKAKAEKARQQIQSFLFGLQSDGTQAASDKGDDIFGQIDADSSGGISADEFIKAFSTSGNGDTDKTGSNDLLNKLFEAIDSDSDGSISKDEQKAFQKAAQDRGPPSPASFGASQAYGNSSLLARQNAAGGSPFTYSQAA